MQNRNISDIIEQYLKDILADSRRIEIKRSEIAQQFDCVPSQINYVISTRFNGFFRILSGKNNPPQGEVGEGRNLVEQSSAPPVWAETPANSVHALQQRD